MNAADLRLAAAILERAFERDRIPPGHVGEEPSAYEAIEYLRSLADALDPPSGVAYLEPPDFLDEIIAERTENAPDFGQMMERHTARRDEERALEKLERNEREQAKARARFEELDRAHSILIRDRIQEQLDEQARLNRVIGAAKEPAEYALKPWPADEPVQYNASGEPCDMWNGPCSCGAWHKNGK